MFGFSTEYIYAAGALLLFFCVFFVWLARHLSRRRKPSGQGMSEAALAEKAVRVAEAAREAILWARLPDRNPGEGNSRPPPRVPEDGPIKLRRNHIYATISRINERQGVFRELDEVRRSSREIFGVQATRPLDVIANTKNLVITRTEALVQLDVNLGGDPRKELIKRRELEITVGLRQPDNGIDPITQQLNEALIPLRAHAKSQR